MTRKNHTPAAAAKTQAAVTETPKEADFHLHDPAVLDKQKFAHQMARVEKLGRHTKLKVQVDQTPGALEEGDIFLFNHFTRFETVVAPYIIHRETGALVRSVAYAGLFEVHDSMTKILHEGGVVSTHTPRLLPFLAEEILRGRKVIIFPEGGLVKDKSVVDAHGNLKMWSGSADKVRKPHRGAAVLGLMLDLTKRRIMALFDAGDTVALTGWCSRLDLGLDELRHAVSKPTRIVPSNITFYPMRTNPNVLLGGLERIAGKQGPRTRDEITIEGNLLLRPTDMNVRFGVPIEPMAKVKRLHTALLDHVLSNTVTTDEIFALKDDTGTLLDGYVAKFVTKQVDNIREEYSRRIYLGTTININHLVATMVKQLIVQGRWEMPRAQFHALLYVALKGLQQREDVHLHATLARPELYNGLLDGKMRGFVGFMEACERAKLIKRGHVGHAGAVYRFSHRLNDVMDLQDIRLENPLQVHANESEPVRGVSEMVAQTLARMDKIDDAEIAKLRFDDMVRAHAGQRYRFGQMAQHTLLAADNAHSGRPYLLLPELSGVKPRKTGVVLVHGFATTPAELRAYADHLREDGYTVLGVRLPGHGTSPLDLETRTRHEWLGAVSEGYEIMAGLADEVVVVGFSTGGALSLLMAKDATAKTMPKLARVASVAAPLLVHDTNMKWLAPGMLLRAILARTPGLRDMLRFYPYERDGSALMYPHVPVTALNQLRLLIGDLKGALPRVTVPVLLLQGLLDRTVQPKSASEIYKKLGSASKAVKWIASGPHGLVTHNFGATWDVLDSFIAGQQLVTGNAGGVEHNIVAEPLRGKKNTAQGPLIRKYA